MPKRRALPIPMTKIYNHQLEVTKKEARDAAKRLNNNL